MLKRLAILTAATLLLGALPVTAQKSCKQGNDLTRMLAQIQAPIANDPATPAVIALEPTVDMASGQLKSCMASEDCNELADISCSGTVCSAISRDCSEGSCQRGSVTCNGVTTQCSQVCPPNCTFFQCRQPCQQPGCFATCIDTCNCECETICH